ncbi:glycoside hydrolase family 15 protein [Nocardioides sp. S-58]|uniref:Glycoside hydrolase family 15 protein n=1 Tax=Nocardioides renjunii TaxID=3095075 RepID=A0ABU5KAI1_9ACTN|nr:glycoside hydrolase family 15 protein [Nocardioides sp. S-58]MDZ5661434.1 glycoside hydrolase family 15 protein [Nocardioides sp. S-58]
MPLRILTGPTALALVATALVAPSSAAAGPAVDDAPARGAKSQWTEADKAGFGTARTRRSNVWFTLQDGRVSEVFHPDLSTPSTRSLELVVTDGRTFTDLETEDVDVVTTRPDERSLRFRQVGTATSGRYRITKTFVTDPRRDALVVRVRLESLDGGRYRLYAVHDPALANSGMDDSGRSGRDGLVATDRSEPVASALVSRPRFGRTSTGVLGRDDGWTDLEGDHRLDDGGRRAGPGNVVQTGRVSGITGLPGEQRATLVLGYGTDGRDALRTATASVRSGARATAARYDRGWHRYVRSLKRVPDSAAGVRAQYLASALVLAAAEDKLNPGALVASPSAPWVWGDEVKDLSSPSGAYHLVWSRDSYQFGTALWAMGDKAAARRSVDWLFDVQQQPDGSFPQNSDVEGTPVWSELQLDEVALPIVLAHLVGRDGPRTYRGVKSAANFLVRFRDEETGRRAPYSPQERWENQSGYSPNSIATQVAGLVCAADIARRNGDRASARRWLRLADRWHAKVKDWTVTTTGPLSEAPYFLRITKDGRPDRGTEYAIGDGGPSEVDQRRVVDPSFLDLVRLGLLPPEDRDVVSTLAVVDADLRVETPNGPYWHRFSFDGYGETLDGGQWEITEDDTGTTLGRAWPLLTGERGEYAVTAGQDATVHLAAMAAAAGSSDMISEQVWDGRAPTGEACCPAGEGTRAATPLTWSHAGLVRLAWTMERGTPVDQPDAVARRYLR